MGDRILVQETNLRLRTFTGEQIEMVGEVMVKAEHNEQVVELPLVLVRDREAPSLLGRDWLEQLKLDWNKIQQVTSPNDRVTKNTGSTCRIFLTWARHNKGSAGQVVIV